MDADGRYEQVRPGDDEPVRDVQETLMAATQAAVESNSSLGVTVDESVVDDTLLIEPADDVDASETTVEGEAVDGEPVDGERGDPTTPEADGGSQPPSVFRQYEAHWYRPDSETYDWAVRTPDGDRRYFKTRDGAAARLQRDYGR
jgi:polyphosphate kinase